MRECKYQLHNAIMLDRRISYLENILYTKNTFDSSIELLCKYYY